MTIGKYTRITKSFVLTKVLIWCNNWSVLSCLCALTHSVYLYCAMYCCCLITFWRSKSSAGFLSAGKQTNYIDENLYQTLYVWIQELRSNRNRRCESCTHAEKIKKILESRKSQQQNKRKNNRVVSGSTFFKRSNKRTRSKWYFATQIWVSVYSSRNERR